MSETAPEPPTQAAAPEVNERLGRVEQAIESLKQLIQGKGPVHAEAQGATQARLSANENALNAGEEAVQELARRDDAIKKAELDARFGKIEQVVLTEKKPESPRRWIEDKMGYHG